MRYPSKILLFGEHTINRGSQALAIPFPVFGGEWKYATDFAKQARLPELLDYLGKLKKTGQLCCHLDISAFREDLQNGIYLDSNIPVGYGLGSSGALCAGIYDRYSQDKIAKTDTARFGELRQVLAQLESFFHGTSSGTDPLICYLQEPVLIHADGTIQTVKIPLESELTFFLLDTKIARATGPMVTYFLQKCNKSTFAEKVTTELALYNNQAIAAFLQAEWEHLFEDMDNISRFQMAELPFMTPDNFHVVWKKGLQGNLYRLKMCGAGGGGFILGCTRDWEQLSLVLSDYFLQKIYPLE